MPTALSAAEAPEIRVGVSPDFRPYDFTDKDGQPAGFTVELVKAVADKMGLRPRFVTGPWDKLWDDFVAGEIDALPTATKTPGREPFADFTVPHTEAFDAFFVRAGRPPIKDLAAAAGKEIVVSRNDAAHHQLLERHFPGKLILVETFPEGLRLIASGKHDALLCSKVVGELERQEAGITGVESGPPIPDYKRVFSFAVRKGNTDLLAKLNQGLQIVKADGTYDRLYRKWLGLEKPPLPNWQEYFWPVVALITMLAVCAAAWRIAREAAKWEERLLRVLTPRFGAAMPAAWRYSLAVGIAAAATALRVALLPWTGAVVPYNLAFLAMIAAAVLLGTGPALVTLVLADIGAEVFVIGSWPVLFEGPTLARMGVAIAIELVVLFVLHAARAAAGKARQDEERYRLLFDSMTEGFAVHEIITDEHGTPVDYRFLEINPAFERLTGLRRKQVVGKTHNEVLPDDSPKWVQMCGEAALTGKPVQFEDYSRALKRHYEVVAYRPAPRQFAVIFMDIAERKAGEEALRKSDERWELALRAAQEGVWDWNMETNEVWYSLRYKEMLGYSEEEVEPHVSAWLRLLHPDDKERSLKVVKAVMRGERDYEMEFRMRHKDGHYLDILSRGCPVRRESDGKVVRIIGTHFDLTARKRAEEALRLSEERFAKSFARSASVMSLVRLTDGVYLDVNEAWTELFGYPRNDVVGRTSSELGLWPDATAQDAMYRRLREYGSIREEEFTSRRASGEPCVLLLSAELITIAGEQVILSSALDITERRKAEEARRKSGQRMAVDLDAMTRLQKIGTLFVREAGLEPVLGEIVDAAMAISGADFGNIQLLDPKSSELRIVAHRGFPQWWLDYWNSVSKGQGSCGTALGRNERVIVEDVEHSPVFVGTPALEIQLKAGVRAVQSTPLISRSGRPLGMFSTHYKKPHRPNYHALRLLDLLARQAADTIERAQAEEALRASEQQFRRAVEEAPIPVIMHAEDGQVLQISRTWTELTGYRPEDIPTFEAWLNHAYGVGAEAVRSHVHELFKGTRRALAADFGIRTRDGQERHWNFSASAPGTLADGRRFVVGMAVDITERKRAEETLRQSEERLSLALAAAGQGLWEYDADRGTVIVSPRMAEIYGLSGSGGLHTLDEWRAPMLEKDRAAVLEAIKQAELANGSYSVEYRIRRASDGEVRWIAAHGRMVQNGRDLPRSRVGVVADITDRKQREQERERLASFPELNPNPIVELDLENRIRYANPAARELFPDLEARGAAHPWLAGCKSLERLCRESGQNLHKRELAMGARWYDQSVNLVPLEGGRVRIYGLDITERKRAEEQLRQFNRILRAHSHSDRALLHAADEQTYLNEVCRIIVEDCGHLMTWVGFAEQGAAKSIRPAASSGFEDGYLKTLKATWADTERGRGPAGTAIRTGKPCICRNMLTDPAFEPWRAEALRRGYTSSIALPLTSEGRVFGILSIYSREPNSFSDEEVKLLTDLSGDFAFGINTLRLRAEHARAAEALRESEERYRRLFENLNSAFILVEPILDGDGRIVDLKYLMANPAVSRHLNKAPEEMVGRRHSQVFHYPGRNPVFNIYEKVLSTGESYKGEIFLPAPKGHYDAAVYRPAPGRLALVLSDITGRKQAEEALRRMNETLEQRVAEQTAEIRRAHEATKSERQRFLDVLDTLPVIITLLRPDHRIAFINQAYRKALGDNLGHLCFASQFGRNEPCKECQAFVPLKTGKPHHWERTLPNGRTFDIYNFPLTDADGSPMILEMDIDITERRRAEAALERASAYNRSLIEASLDPLVTIGPDGKITDVNAATEMATGRARTELVGTDFSGYFTDPEKAREGYRKVFREGSVRDYPLEIRHRDGLVTPVLYHAAVYRDQRGEVIGVFAAARDITERLQSERALAERSAEVQRLADQLRALASELSQTEQRERQRLAKILHDNVQQLLVAAQMQLSLIKRANPEIIQSTVQGVDGILAETLEASRSLTVELCPPVLHQSGLVAALSWLAARMEEKQQFKVRLRTNNDAEPASPDVRAFLFEAAREMLLNAAKHSGSRQAHLTMVRTKDECCRIIVEDKGRGFDPASLKPGPSGGFGLFSIQQRLLYLGGKLEIESALGEGTKAVLTMPIGRAPAIEVPPLAPSVEGVEGGVFFKPKGQRINILLVDDHKIMRQGLSSLLQFENDLEVIAEAENGQRALEMARQHKPDVVVMDVNMPVMNGIEATKILMKEMPHLKVIALSMHLDGEAANAMREAGAVAFLTKGGPSEDLVEAIRACCRQRTMEP
jgi:PAS domain S-box-containing protein